MKNCEDINEKNWEINVRGAGGSHTRGESSPRSKSELESVLKKLLHSKIIYDDLRIKKFNTHGL